MVSSADIFEGSRPAAAWITNSTIFNVPGCEPGFGQGCAQMTSVGQIIFGTPVAAVNKKHHWMRALPCWNSQINKLIRIWAVRNPQIGFRWLLGKDGFALHGSSISLISQTL